MVLEREISSFLDWFLWGSRWWDGALAQFSITVVALALLAIVVGFVVQLIRHGPVKAGEHIYRTIRDGFSDLTRVSPQRVSALAGLAIKESIRRRVLVGLVVFLAVLLFAAWFVQTDHQDPAKLNVSVVMTATSFLMLLLALLISTFSLPNEFKTKTIYTIVTKPVRAGDIVLGRILGFTAVGTFMLAIMCLCSYVFVTRSLEHKHAVDPSSLEDIVAEDGSGEVFGRRGATLAAHSHTHEVETDAEGAGVALSAHGHEHRLNGGAEATSGVERAMRARVPKYGTLRFLDRNGAVKERGVSVGQEWGYRSFIEGGTQAAAIWTFADIDASDLEGAGADRYLPIELIVRVFRTHKGIITRPIQGGIQLRNPETNVTSNIETFGAKDFSIDSHRFSIQQTDSDGSPIDLLDDLVSKDGRLEVIVQSLERAQYYGFAQADCYIRLPEDSAELNFVKGYLSIWVQMVVVIAIGVTASTFLNGPIATMCTTAFVLLGFCRDFLIGIATGVQPNGEKVYGGGPVEAFVRIITHKNLTTNFEENIGVSLMKGVDDVLQMAIRGVAYVLPNFQTLSSSNYVAEGFSIPSAVIGRELAIAVAYVIGMSIAGYFFLRTREVAK